MKKKVLFFLAIAVVVIAGAVYFYGQKFDKNFKELIANVEKLAEVESITYDSSSYNFFLKSTSVKNLKINYKANNDYKSSYSIELLTLTNLNKDAIINLINRDPNILKQKFKILNSLALNGVKSEITFIDTGLKTTTDIDSIIYQNISYYGNKNELESISTDNRAQFLATFLKSIKCDSIEQNNTNLEVIKSGSNLVAKADKISIKGLAQAKINDFQISGLSLNFHSAPKESLNEVDGDVFKEDSDDLVSISVGLTDFNITNFDFSELMNLIVILAKDDFKNTNYLEERNPFASWYGYDKGEAHNFSLTINDKKLITIAQIGSQGLVRPNEFPGNAESFLKNMIIDFSAAPNKDVEDIFMVLREFGYDKLVIDLNSKVTYSEKDKVFKIENYSLDIHDAFKFQLQWELDNFLFAETDFNINAFMGPLSALANKKLVLSLENQGVAEKSINFFEKYKSEDNSYKEEVKSKIALFLKSEDFTMIENRDDLIAELSIFVDDPKSIVISTGHSAPVVLISLSMLTPGQIVDLLKPTIKVNNNKELVLKGKDMPVFQENKTIEE